MAFSGIYGNLQIPFPNTAFDPILLEFLDGVLVAYVSPRLSTKGWKYYLVAGMAGTTAFIVSKLFWVDPGRVFLGFSFALVVLAMVLFERVKRINVPGWLLNFGAGSYAIYLVHNPIISLAARLFSKADSWMITFVGSALIGITAGMLYHFWFKMPALKLLRPARLPASHTGKSTMN